MKPRWSKTHNRWRVYYRSKAFHNWFKRQNLETLKQYIEDSKETVVSFLRGLYDSDGYNKRCRQIFLYNNNINILKYVQYLLRKYYNIIATGPYLHTRAGSISRRRSGEKIKTNYNTYYIAISRKRHIKIFLSEVGFSIREKQLGLPRRKLPNPHPFSQLSAPSGPLFYPSFFSIIINYIARPGFEPGSPAFSNPLSRGLQRPESLASPTRELAARRPGFTSFIYN